MSSALMVNMFWPNPKGSLLTVDSLSINKTFSATKVPLEPPLEFRESNNCFTSKCLVFVARIQLIHVGLKQCQSIWNSLS